MKLTITGIRKLTDGTVTFTGTTEKENYLPLVIMDNDGKDIHLSAEQEEVTESTFLLVMRDMILTDRKESEARGYERGKAEAIQGNLLTERGEGNE